MILKPHVAAPPTDDPRLRAGRDAERQMAFYLHRAFVADRALVVLNDLRIVDPEQPEGDGSPGVCQIDHLVAHRWGMFIVESKSATGEVTVRDDGHGGDEWTRKFKGVVQGFPSPIQQARRQADFLRAFLNRHKESLRARAPIVLRTINKAIGGSEHRGFMFMPIQIVVAISDSGAVRRIGGWTEPSKPFQVFVSKADLVPQKIRAEVKRHLLGLVTPTGEYGLWAMSLEERGATTNFLASSHTPRSRVDASAAATASAPAGPNVARSIDRVDTAPFAARCKSCGGADLDALWGRYGYYWKCRACGVNTAMPAVCSACGAEGSRGRTVRITMEGAVYYRRCEACGVDERVWGGS